MPYEHVNRCGDRYVLQAGTTRTGKPKYYMGRKVTGTPLESVPAGYEVYESPETAQVVVRKAQTSAILPVEKERLAARIRRDAGLKHFLIDLQANSLVVYLPNTEEDEASELVRELSGPFGSLADDLTQRMVTQSQYTKMMRFTLADVEERLYTVERWCFRGGIDNWFPLPGRAPLADLAAKYVRHLGRQSFFDLM